MSGLATSVPIGPINITIVNDGSRMGFRSALAIGIGATCMELVYCTIAFTSFAVLFESHIVRAAMELISFSLVTILGLGYFLAKERDFKNFKTLVAEGEKNNIKWWRAFSIGFSRILLNPIVLLFWITVSAIVIQYDLFNSEVVSERVVFIGGVGIGCVSWFCFLTYEVIRHCHKFSAKTLWNISRISGLMLLCMSLVLLHDIWKEIF